MQKVFWDIYVGDRWIGMEFGETIEIARSNTNRCLPSLNGEFSLRRWYPPKPRSGHIARISGLLFRAESPSKLILLGTAGQAELLFNGTSWVLSIRSLQYGSLEFPFPSRSDAVEAIFLAMEFAANEES